MATPSPSDCLTFSRRLVTMQCLRYRTVARPAFRPFSISTARRADTANPNFVSDKGTQQDTGTGSGVGASREHALDKGNKKDPNVQSHASSSGREARQNDTGGTATEQRDDQNSTAKAKKEHPEAPDTVIGMQDERGGKGA